MVVPRQAITLLRRLARTVGATTDDTVRALAAQWVAAWDDLSPAWRQAIEGIVDEYQRTGTWPPSWKIARIEAVARAQEQTRRSLTLLFTEASTATKSAAEHISAVTAQIEPGIIAAQLSGRDARKAADPVVGSALRSRQARISALHGPLLAATTTGIQLGLTRKPGDADPARQQLVLFNQTRARFDSGLIRASTIARTELVDTYRTAAGLVHTANGQSLTGWCWFCVCDRRSCPSCWAMHGQTFPLDTPGPDGHGGCRCTRLPLAAGSSLPSAETRFRRLSRRDQIAVLGPGRWQLWHSGQTSWADLAVRRTNRGWRDTYVPRSVADLRRLAGIRT